MPVKRSNSACMSWFFAHPSFLNHMKTAQSPMLYSTGLWYKSGGDLFSRAVTSQVSWALRSLTAVFGMGTGVTFSSFPPERYKLFDVTGMYPVSRLILRSCCHAVNKPLLHLQNYIMYRLYRFAFAMPIHSWETMYTLNVKDLLFNFYLLLIRWISACAFDSLNQYYWSSPRPISIS